MTRGKKVLHFLNEVVAFPLVTAGEEREALATLADRLCGEFGYPTGEQGGKETYSPPDDVRTLLFAGLLEPEDEVLVATARQGLDRIAAALGTRHRKMVSETVYRALIDGSELMMRSELAAGNRIAPAMPSFVFLIALPMLDQDEALALSRCASTLLEATSG